MKLEEYFDIPNLQIAKRSDLSKLKTQKSTISKQKKELTIVNTELVKLKDEARFNKNTPHPSVDYLASYGTMAGIGFGQQHGYFNRVFYDLARMSGELQTIFGALKREIFRNSYDFESKWTRKCEQCDEEFDFELESCTTCGSGLPLLEPNFKSIKRLYTFFEKVNDSGQNFTDVLWDCEDDLQVADECFMVLLKDYDYDVGGMIIGSEVKQIIRGSPIQFDLVRDTIGRFGYNENGEKILVCPLHRTIVYENSNLTHCPVCKDKTILYSVHFRERLFYGASGAQDSEMNYYIEGEVLYTNKYNPNRFRGLSQIVSVQAKVEALIAMDIYVRDYYSKQRPPKGLLMINTANTKELEKAWEKMLKDTRGNPNLIHPWAVQSNSTRGDVAQFIDFMNKMNENEYVPTRQEFRTVIGAQFGVMPLFQGDMSQGAGLNNEGLEITVTNRAVEVGQGIWNKKLFPRLMAQFGIVEFNLVLNPSEEQDEAADVDLDIKKTQHAQIMQSMGFEVSRKGAEKLEFTFSEEPTAPAMGSPGVGGFGGDSLGFGSGQQGAGAGTVPTLENVGDQRFGGEPASVRLSKVRSPIVLGRSMKKRLLEIFDKVFKSFDYKRKPTEQRLREVVEDVSRGLNKSLTRAMGKEMKDLYKEAQLGISKELGVKIGFGKIDENALEVVKNQRVFKSAFKNFNEGVRESLSKTITESFEEPTSVSELVDKLSESVDLKQSDLVRIARTESHHISVIARSNSYFKSDPGGKGLYRWTSTPDHRRTETCKEITERSKNGLKKSDLKALLHEVSKKHGHKPRDWDPHINCRSTILRMIKLGPKKGA